MFVRQSTYARLELKHTALAVQYRALMAAWNALVERINRKGGETFLRGGLSASPDFSDDDLKKLISLVHPDKHGGSKIAEEMTKRLLAMRGKSK